MPILDPSLQLFFVNKQIKNSGDSLRFFLKYLQIAANNLAQNSITIGASIQFRNDLVKCTSFINKELKIPFCKRNLGKIITNYFEYIYNHINSNKLHLLESHDNLNGEYFICSNTFSTRIFQPEIYNSKYHSWFFSDTPIAILTINYSNFKKANLDLIFQQIKLEIDLMQASGLTLILCTDISFEIKDFIFWLIEDNQFSEIHINIFDGPNMENFLLGKNDNDAFSLLSSLTGYFYIYSFFDQINLKSQDVLDNLIEIPNLKFVLFVKDIKKSLRIIISRQIEPFSYCQTGFSFKLLRIFLSNVPLYDTPLESKSISPSKISKLAQGNILKEDFQIWKEKRIKIYFEDRQNNNRVYEKYVDFDDIHLIREQFYVNSVFDLVKVDEKSFRYIEKIYNNWADIFNESELQSFNKINKIFEKNSSKNVIEHIIYLYAFCTNIRARKPQIYTIFEACQTILGNKYYGFNKYHENQENKGAIYQVETGEGKTSIVAIIAAVLATNNKIVHIVSSNIKLSKRDYAKSFYFLNRLLNFQSAVLFRKDDLPVCESSNNNNNEYDNLFTGDKNDDDMVQHFLRFIKKRDKDDNSSYYIDKDFYGSEAFNNSSRINYCVCGFNDKNECTKKANIIFSTISNFECVYLRMLEKFPNQASEYFSNCVLLIDEADSILIDEISNGTIISRELKTNSREILKFVYDQKMKNASSKDTFDQIKNDYSNCGDLKESDIERMYSEIELVQTPEFKDGKKYTIETVKVKKEKIKKKLYKKVLKYAGKLALKVGKGLVEEFINNKDDDDDDDDNDDNDDDDNDEEEEEEADQEDDNQITEFHEIVPYDYDHKGISEPSKEFSGFIQQFIAINESEQHGVENMIIKDVSMSYLYISHPIFIKLYQKVCGFTGTIGTKEDRQIYRKHYNLVSTFIPRNSVNKIVKFPTILCDSIEERNYLIVKETYEFFMRKNPVLVIFQDISEIETVELMLNKKGIKYINVFDGKTEFIKPDTISGLNGAVTLGSNFCGRGTDIKAYGKHLHVIVSYYTPNKRVMDQAHGRTGRQGKEGTTRIICLRRQFLMDAEVFNEEKINASIKDFSMKNQKQLEFIEHFRHNRDWIFSSDKITEQEISDSNVLKLRNARINVNRIVAYKYEFPIKMKIKTFLKIQAQKIFSIINCPNSIYTWRIFQRYVREMILQSWSLMINKFDYKFKGDINSDQYENELNEKIKKLYKKLNRYFPPYYFGIFPTFMNIFDKVLEDHEQSVLDSFNFMSNAFWQFNETPFFSVQVGFKPFSLLTKSGARITYKTLKKMNYITDPELKYEKKNPKTKRITLSSITDKIDDIFNSICQKINSILGKKTFLKFFLRRMICGCEFGVCLDFKYENEGIKDSSIIIDKDPLLLFTISVRSYVPILAGILLFVLIYLASISKKIVEWFACFPKKITKEVALRCVSVVVNVVAPELVGVLLDKVIKFLNNELKKQLQTLDEFNSKISQKAVKIIKKLVKIFNSSLGQNIVKKVTNKLTDCIKITFDWQKLIKNCLDPVRLMKISFLLLLNLAVYIMNFNLRKDAIEKSEEYAEEYQNEPTKENIDSLVDKHKDEAKIDETIDKDLNENTKKQIEESYSKVSKTYLFKYSLLDPLDKVVKLSEFYEENKEVIQDGISTIRNFVTKKGKKKCKRIQYSGLKKQFIQQVGFYLTNKMPSILQIIGYSCSKRRQYLFVQSKEKGTLDLLIQDKNIKIDETSKLIISYGIASAIKYLHKNNIVHRNLKPSNIYIDSNFYPYVSDFYLAKQTEMEVPYNLIETTIKFMAPEFISDYKKHQNSFKLDVYSFGVILFILMTEKISFEIDNKSNDLKEDILLGKRPKIPSNIAQKWINLINECWNQDPTKRPSFSQICKQLESPEFVSDNVNIKAFNSYKKIIKEGVQNNV